MKVRLDESIWEDDFDYSEAAEHLETARNELQLAKMSIGHSSGYDEGSLAGRIKAIMDEITTIFREVE